MVGLGSVGFAKRRSFWRQLANLETSRDQPSAEARETRGFRQ